MFFRFDWKFVVTTLLSALAVALPILLWKADLSSKEISFEVVSSTGLDPAEKELVQGLAVNVDGEVVPMPFLSVLLIRNTGSRPIPSDDFEGPIEIRVQTPTKILRSEVADSKPPDLRPQIHSAEGTILLNPLLLNPGDTIKLNILSSVAPPSFVVRGRVSGVPSIEVIKPKSTKTSFRYWFQVFFGVVLLSIYVVQLVQALQAYRRRSVIQVWTIFVAFTTLFGGTLLLQEANTARDFTSKQFLIQYLLSAPLAIAMTWLRSRWGNAK